MAAPGETMVPMALMSHMNSGEPNAFDAVAQLNNPQVLVSAMDATNHYSAPPLPYESSPSEMQAYVVQNVKDNAKLKKARNKVWLGISALAVLDFFLAAVPAALFIIFRFNASLGTTLVGLTFFTRLSTYIYMGLKIDVLHMASATQAIIKNGQKSVVPRFMHVIGAIGSHQVFWYEHKAMGTSITISALSLHLTFLYEHHHSEATFILAVIYSVFHIFWPLIGHAILQYMILERNMESFNAAFIKDAVHKEIRPLEIRKPR